MTNTVITTDTVSSTHAVLHAEGNKMCHFLANVIFIAFVGVILKPWRASFAVVD